MLSRRRLFGLMAAAPLAAATAAATPAVDTNVNIWGAALDDSAFRGIDTRIAGGGLTMTMEEYSERYIAPAMARLASNIEADAMGLYSQALR